MVLSLRLQPDMRRPPLSRLPGAIWDRSTTQSAGHAHFADGQLACGSTGKQGAAPREFGSPQRQCNSTIEP